MGRGWSSYDLLIMCYDYAIIVFIIMLRESLPVGSGVE